ncbi:MAG: glycosyltransferase [Streptococcaceae bacterium]|jgi:glycosyltransferase involved in cell wall biosynthesis|nr:glycosyltransferase [Streptococcaceae bacterium]
MQLNSTHLNQANLAIVVVTFKRQELLQVLMDSIKNLTIHPTYLVVVDNENSQDTKVIVENTQSELSDVNVNYVPMTENTGGAGGFSKGVEVAYNLGAEWIWVMDDDVKVFPEAIEKLEAWIERAVENDTRAIQVCRKNFDGSDFYWQYDFKNHLGIPNPISPSGFADGETFKKINTMCFEGGLFHRSIVAENGLPDSRFFIYWDDTMYGYLASKITQPILINETLMARTRTLDNVKIGKVRRLNSTSDMTRYYIMRNRGYMTHYFKLHGDYRPLTFTFGTFLTLVKETIRLGFSENFFKSLKILLNGMKDGKKARKDKSWTPMPKLEEIGTK